MSLHRLSIKTAAVLTPDKMPAALQQIVKQFDLDNFRADPHKWDYGKRDTSVIYLIPGKDALTRDVKQALKQAGFTTEDGGKNFDAKGWWVQVDKYKGGLWVHIQPR